MDLQPESRILLADDDVNARNLLAAILREAGYRRIEQAGDGVRALGMLCDPSAGYNVAFLDIEMPGHSGIDVMARVKAAQLDCACVIISGHSAVENVMAALNGGALGFIVKPYTAKKIHDVLHKLGKEKA